MDIGSKRSLQIMSRTALFTYYAMCVPGEYNRRGLRQPNMTIPVTNHEKQRLGAREGPS